MVAKTAARVGFALPGQQQQQQQQQATAGTQTGSASSSERVPAG
jgi:hypothetical protein